jgi:hypothetical protein
VKKISKLPRKSISDPKFQSKWKIKAKRVIMTELNRFMLTKLNPHKKIRGIMGLRGLILPIKKIKN